MTTQTTITFPSHLNTIIEFQMEDFQQGLCTAQQLANAFGLTDAALIDNTFQTLVNNQSIDAELQSVLKKESGLYKWYAALVLSTQIDTPVAHKLFNYLCKERLYRKRFARELLSYTGQDASIKGCC